MDVGGEVTFVVDAIDGERVDGDGAVDVQVEL